MNCLDIGSFDKNDRHNGSLLIFTFDVKVAIDQRGHTKGDCHGRLLGVNFRSNEAIYARTFRNDHVMRY